MKIYKSAIVLSAALLSQLASANQIEEVQVTAHPLASDGFTQPISVLKEDELAESLRGSLGETVAKQPGIHSASFGAAVGRPVIHGLGGVRVKTTEDRIDSLDLSVNSPDHAVAVEPFIADQITVLKGASTLLYGSGAIGGVVDVQTGRIIKSKLDKPFSGRLELRKADNADSEVAAFRTDGALSDNVFMHIDAFYRNSDDYDIPGFSESARLRAQEESEESHEEHDEHEHEEGEEHSRDVLEGSFAKSKGGAVGLSWVGDQGFVGFSVSQIDSDYGIIGHEHAHEDEHDEEEGHEEEHHDEDEHEEEGIGRIDLEQTRFDIEAQLNNPFSGFEKANFRLGVNDYQHKEIEASGETGTTFDNQAWEGRLELTHKALAGFTGVVGLQVSDREFSALGEEAFLMPVESQTAGLFWVGESSFEAFSIEAGLRYDVVEHQPTDNQTREFKTGSASFGVFVPLSEHWSFSTLLDYSSRAPSIEELYSNGAHLATQSFELGNSNLNKESVASVTLTLSHQSDFFDFGLSVYRMEFDDFIYQANNGETRDDLNLLRYLQSDANFTGLDLKFGVHLFSIADHDLDLNFLADMVDAKVKGQANERLPRIPSNRYGVGLKWANEDWTLKLDYLNTLEQDKVAQFELPTDSYSDVSAYVSRRFTVAGNDLNVFIHGRNLGDQEQRNHTSFIKDLAPAPGRRFEVGLRYRF